MREDNKECFNSFTLTSEGHAKVTAAQEVKDEPSLLWMVSVKFDTHLTMSATIKIATNRQWGCEGGGGSLFPICKGLINK